MPERGTPARWWLYFFIPTAAVLSCFFLFQTFQTPAASAEPELLQPEWYSVATARGEELKNKPMVGNCFLCHAYWVPIPRSNQTSNPRFAHGNIKLNHGNNDRCYNCHMISDRNKYTANDGSGIMAARVETMCSRCHGLIYNDWLMGTHGKWTGMWLPKQKHDRISYTCTECHDPHNPAFRFGVIAPAPVWPEKYIRSKIEGGQAVPFSNFMVDDPPKEIF